MRSVALCCVAAQQDRSRLVISRHDQRTGHGIVLGVVVEVEALQVVGRHHGMRAQLRIGDDRCLVALEDHRGIFRDREIFVTVAQDPR